MGQNVGEVYAVLGLDKSSFSSSLKGASSEFDSFGSSLQSKAGTIAKSVGAALVVGTAALAGVATVGVKAYADIESAAADAASKMDLGAIAAKSNTSLGESFNTVKGHVIDLSRELGTLSTNSFDPTQIAGAMANLAAGGFDVASASAKDLAPILSLATAANYDLKSSAEVALSTMNMYGLKVQDLGHISDIYTLASGKSAAGMVDFKDAMSYIGPSAQNANVSLEESVAMIGKLRDIGIPASTVGTSLRDGMQTFVGAQPVFVKALESIGLKTSDVDLNSHKFIDSLKIMREQADKTGKGAKVFIDAFGVTGDTLYNLAGMKDSVVELTNDLQDSTGAAEKMAGFMNSTLTGAWNTAIGSATDLGISIGEYLRPALVDTFKWFSESGAPAIQEFIDAIADGDWDSVGDMIKKGFKYGLNSLSGLGSDLWKKIKPAIDYVGDKFGPSMKKALTFAGEIAGAALVTKGILAIAPSALTVAGSIASMASKSLVSFGIMTQGALAAKLGFISTWAAAIGPIAGVVAAIGLITAGLGALGYALNPGKFTTFNTVAIDAFNGIKDVVTDCFSLIMAGDFSGVADRLKTAFSSSLDYIKDIDWGALGSDIVSMVADGAYAIIGGALDLAGWIHDNLQEWVDTGGPQRLGQDIGDGIGKLIESVVGSNYDYWGAIKGAFGVIGDWVTIAYDIAVGIGEGLYNNISPYVAKVRNYFVDAAAGMIESFTFAGLEMGAGIVKGLNSVIGQIESFINDIKTKVGDAYTFVTSFGSSSSDSSSFPSPDKTYRNKNTNVEMKGSQLSSYAIESDYEALGKQYKNVETLEQRVKKLNVLSEMQGLNTRYDIAGVAPTNNYLNVGGVKTSSENPNGFTNTNLKNEYIKAGYTKENPGPGGVYVDKVGNVKYVPQINKETGKQETANEGDKRLDQIVNKPHEKTSVDKVNDVYEEETTKLTKGITNVGKALEVPVTKLLNLEVPSTEENRAASKIASEAFKTSMGRWDETIKTTVKEEKAVSTYTTQQTKIASQQTKIASAYSYNSVLLGANQWSNTTWTAADTWKATNNQVSAKSIESSNVASNQIQSRFAIIGSVAQSQFLAAGGSISSASKDGSVWIVGGSKDGAEVHKGGITTGANVHVDAMKAGAGILTGALAGVVAKPKIDFTKNLAPDDSGWTTEGFEEIENSSLKAGKAIENGGKKAEISLNDGAAATRIANQNSLLTNQQINTATKQSTIENLYKMTGAYNYFGATVLNGGYSNIATSAKINADNQLSAANINAQTAINYDEIGIKFIKVTDNIGEQTKQTGEGLVKHVTDTDSGLCAAGDNVEESLTTGAKNAGDSLASAANSCSTILGVTASNIIGLANRGGGAVWGGTGVGGGGAWIGTGSTAVGGRGYVPWGGTAVSNYVSTLSTGGLGSFRWGARGGLFDNGPEIIGIGEEGKELALPSNITETLLALTNLGFAKINNKSENIKIASNDMAQFMGRNSENISPKELNKNMNVTIIMEMDGKQMARAIMPFAFGDVKRAGMKLKH